MFPSNPEIITYIDYFKYRHVVTLGLKKQKQMDTIQFYSMIGIKFNLLRYL